MAANKGGRPLKFKSETQLQEKIDAYFASCFIPVIQNGEPVIDMDGKPLMEQAKPFTMAGLAAFLDCDRKTLLNYSHKEKYFPTIKKARQKIEAYVEEQLFSPKIAAGVIFNLKNNFDWKDKQEVTHEIEGVEGFFTDEKTD